MYSTSEIRDQETIEICFLRDRAFLCMSTTVQTINQGFGKVWQRTFYLSSPFLGEMGIENRESNHVSKGKNLGACSRKALLEDA